MSKIKIDKNWLNKPEHYVWVILSVIAMGFAISCAVVTFKGCNSVIEKKASIIRDTIFVYPETYMQPLIMEELLNNNFKKLEQQLNDLFASIPYQLHIKKEAYYHSLMLIWLNMRGFKVEGEVSTSIGRIDFVWQNEKCVIIGEVKYSADGKTVNLLDQAIKQILDNRYPEKYRKENKRIVLLGIAVIGEGKEKRTVACQMKELQF